MRRVISLILNMRTRHAVTTKVLLDIIPWRQNPKFHHRIHNSPSPAPILSHLNPLQIPQPISPRSILIPSSHLRIGLPSDLFPSGFPTKTLYTFCPLPCVPHVPPTSFPCLDLPNDIWGTVQFVKLPACTWHGIKFYSSIIGDILMPFLRTKTF
jgi:hypothetical protein